MSSIAENLPFELHGSMLSALRDGWTARGWNLDDLAGYRMEGDPPPDPPAPKVDPPADPPKTFTQDDLNQIAAREKEQGKRAAEKAIADALGMTPDEAKKVIEAHREAEKGRMTEAERKLADAQEAEKKATERETAAAERERRALVREALAEADVKADRKNAALTLVLADLPADADEAAIKAAIEDTKKGTPEFFGETKTDPPVRRTPPSGDVKGTPPRQAKGGDDTFKQRMEQAAARQGAKVAS